MKSSDYRSASTVYYCDPDLGHLLTRVTMIQQNLAKIDFFPMLPVAVYIGKHVSCQLTLLILSHNEVHDLWPIIPHRDIYLKEIVPIKNKGLCLKTTIQTKWEKSIEISSISYLFSQLGDMWNRSYSLYSL